MTTDQFHAKRDRIDDALRLAGLFVSCICALVTLAVIAFAFAFLPT